MKTRNEELIISFIQRFEKIVGKLDEVHKESISQDFEDIHTGTLVALNIALYKKHRRNLNKLKRKSK